MILGQNTQRFVWGFFPFLREIKNKTLRSVDFVGKRKRYQLNKTVVQNMYFFLFFSHHAENIKHNVGNT